MRKSQNEHNVPENITEPEVKTTTENSQFSSQAPKVYNNIETKPEKKKNKGGRPLKFPDPIALEKLIDEYFVKCEQHQEDFITKDGEVVKINKPQIPCIAGLADHLGTDRQTIYNYNNKDEYLGIIKRARSKILGMIEKHTLNSATNPAGKIFIMKNYGYSDKQEIEFVKPLEVIVKDYRGREIEADYSIEEEEGDEE